MTRPTGHPDQVEPAGYCFPRRLRVSHRREFLAVYNAGARRRCGPLLVYARPNGLPVTRLGLSVPRRVGNAVGRNRVKRRLREAFRLNRAQWAAGYDVVVNVQPHKVESRDAYARYLGTAIEQLDAKWQRRTANDGGT